MLSRSDTSGGRWVKRDVAMGRSGAYERVGATRTAGGIVVVGGREEMVRDSNAGDCLHM